MVTRAANWGPWDYHTPVSLVSSLSLPPLLTSSTSPASASSSAGNFQQPHSTAPVYSTANSSVSPPQSQNGQPSSSSHVSGALYTQNAGQQPDNHYNYGSTAVGNMSHQQQPRQPPSLNMAAAAATQDPSPYSAPAVTHAAYYGNSGGATSGASSATSTGGSGSFGYGSAAMLTAPQQSQTYASGPQYPVSTFTTQHSAGPHRVHADVAGLSQHSLHEFHHGSGNAPLDGSLLHGFDGSAMLPMKAKRKQVKNACVNCQKACKRCDEARPCSRCFKYGLTATCQDSARKERKRGIKRGPYKRRATTGSTPNNPTPAILQHSSAMMLGSGIYSSSGVQSVSPHLRSNASLSGSFRADSNGSGASSLYDGSSGGFDGSHLINSAQYTSSAPSSIQRMPTSLPSSSGSLYDSPSVYGREPSHVSMQPPSGRPFGATRGDYDRSSGSNYSIQYSNLNNTGNRYGTATGANPSGGMPGSAPAGVMGFANPANCGSRLSASTPTGPGGFSPAMSQQQQQQQQQQSQMFLNVQHHRIHSDGSLATASNGSVTTPSTSLSPRTPMGISGSDVNALSVGGDNKAGLAYLHHANSASMSNISSSTASAFMNPQSNSNTGSASGNSTPQPFSLHLPQAPRGRNGSGNNSTHSNASNHEDRSRPTSRQDGAMAFSDSKDALDVNGNGNGSLTSRYQLPVPHSGSGDNRPRSLLPKMDNAATDIAAYGAAA